MDSVDDDIASDRADGVISVPPSTMDGGKENDLNQDTDNGGGLEILSNGGRYAKIKPFRIKMPSAQRLSHLKDAAHSASNTPRSACTPSPADSRKDSEYDILAEDDDGYDEGLSPSHIVPPNMLIAGLEGQLQSAAKRNVPF
jgi:hypothetical protein